MNKRIKIALILIAIILIAALAVSLAYSRYFSSISGKGEATVAKWSFKATANGQPVNLGTITLGNTRSDNDKVAEGKVAPGTSGKFTVALDATGTEVALDYTIKFANVSSPFPTNLKFYATKNADGTYSDEITNITTQGLTGSIELDATTNIISTIKNVDLYWVWEYQTGADDTAKGQNDKTDTTEGQNAAKITFDVVVTGTQQQKQNV